MTTEYTVTPAYVDPRLSSDVWEKLRAPFPIAQIGKLPRIPRHLKGSGRASCKECGGYHEQGSGVVHLDYVGHAAVTSRLLSVDPLWNWRPKASDEHGLPLFDTDEAGNKIGLWILLEVGGITRLGYGSVPPDTFDAEKQLIGDALRNAAMRFGVAVDLWMKTREEEDITENSNAKTATRPFGKPGEIYETPTKAIKGEVWQCVKCKTETPSDKARPFKAKHENFQLNVKVGDLMYRCECGQFVPARPANWEADDEKLPAGMYGKDAK